MNSGLQTTIEVGTIVVKSACRGQELLISRLQLEGSKVTSVFKGSVILTLCAITVLVSSCSLDPNARKQKYFQSGQRYFENRQFQEAAIEFTNAIKIDPKYAEARYQLAESYRNLQELDRAHEELIRTIELRPEDYQARMTMLNVLVQGHNFQEAQQVADLLLSKRPFDPAAHSAVAGLMAAENNISGAIVETEQAIGLDPGRWELHLSLGLLQLKANQPDLAEASFKKVIDLNPKAVQARLLLGAFYQSRQRMGEAEQQYRVAVTGDPTSMAPRKALAELYLKEGRKGDAEATLQQARRDLPQNPEGFLALSEFYYATGALDKSVTEYQALYQKHSTDVEIKKKYVQLLIQANRFDEARALVNEMLKANPGDADALIYRSQMQVSSGDLAEATQVLQHVIKNSPENAQAHYVLGVALEKQGNLGYGESEWREALRINPDMVDAQSAMAAAAIRQGDIGTLQDAATQLIRLRPWSADGYALRGLAQIHRSHYAEAEADIRKAIAVAPADAFGYVQMGNLRLAQKQYGDATKAFQNALDRNANSTDALRGLMNTHIAEREVDKAVALVNAQIARSPANSKFYELRGTVLFHDKKDLGGAEAAFQKAVALDKHNSDAALQLCQVQAAKGEVDQAIVSGEQSLKEGPRQASLGILMGNLYATKHEWKRAEDAFQNVLALDSQNPAAANGLARVMLCDGGSLDVALALAQTARKGLPDSPGVVDTMGWIYYQKGVYTLAISNLQEALELQGKQKMPDDPDIHYHLGMAYERGAQPGLARQHFEHVLKSYPNYNGAAEIKKELNHLNS